MNAKHFFRVLCYKVLPINIYMGILYRHIYGRKLNLRDPKTFSEKICWLKLYYGQYLKETIQLLYDKFTVREWVKNRIGEEYLNELYGVYDNAEEIDFTKLPREFALKISQSSGKNIICVDKYNLNIDQTVNVLNRWLREANKGKIGLEESYYFTGDSKIICEKFLKTKEHDIPCDYRFYCFNGEPKYIIYDIETTLRDGSHGNNIRRNVYNTNWDLLDIEFGRPRETSMKIDKPRNLDKMLDIAKILSKDFPFVRVDLYNINGTIIFGELTWIPMGGLMPIKPDEFDYKLGKILELPDVKLTYKK